MGSSSGLITIVVMTLLWHEFELNCDFQATGLEVNMEAAVREHAHLIAHIRLSICSPLTPMAPIS